MEKLAVQEVVSAVIAVLNKMRYTPLATDALCPMPYALCPMPARAPHVTEKGYKYYGAQDAIVMTNSKFTSNAHKQAQAKGVQLWGREQLIDLVIRAKK
ncbi:restriction endonuclease [Microcoleus sp. herbarium2]|uniref:restriction endonuclease n=1 Tax=Microcoleus sp. herbarium2 TaxID=3055433 RepID=UPI002FCFFEEA